MHLLTLELDVVDSACGAMHVCCRLFLPSPYLSTDAAFFLIIHLMDLWARFSHYFIPFARSRQARAALPFWQACCRQDT
jgi:hypothetical protein